jgi:signal peptidase I
MLDGHHRRDGDLRDDVAAADHRTRDRRHGRRLAVAMSNRNRLTGLLFLLVAVAGCAFFAPVELGGSTLYSATVGNSMEPRFHKGDLAVMRVAGSYKVGDVVLYHSLVLDRPVLHRIIALQHGRYYFKGDHNDFVDPGFVTSKDLLGKLWFRVPRAGRALSWVGAPGHASLVAGAAVLFLFFGTGRKPVRRRRHGRRRSRKAQHTMTARTP